MPTDRTRFIGAAASRYSGEHSSRRWPAERIRSSGSRLLAVAEESPGEAERVGGAASLKEYAAMGSLGGEQAAATRTPRSTTAKLVPGGVDAIVAVAGPLSESSYQLIGGPPRPA